VYYEGGTGRYEYNIRDHLGNTRLTFTDKDGDGTIEVSSDPEVNEILQENHYYPFGMAMDGQWMANAGREDKYQYNGKELHDDFGLGWYAYGARFYDPVIGRFTGVDPIADRFPWVSTYNYAENEPVGSIDLHGLQRVKVSELAEKFAGNDDKGLITTATPKERDNHPVRAGIKDASFVLLSMMGINAIDNSIATLRDPSASTSEKIAAGFDLFTTTKGGKGKASQLKANKKAGKAFEEKVREQLKADGHTDIVEQVTIKAKDGTKTRVDFLSTKEGQIQATEAKASSTAPLTKNQSKAHPQINNTGGVIVGKGKGKFSGGTNIPPTSVNVVRPKKDN